MNEKKTQKNILVIVIALVLVVGILFVIFMHKEEPVMEEPVVGEPMVEETTDDPIIGSNVSSTNEICDNHTQEQFIFTPGDVIRYTDVVLSEEKEDNPEPVYIKNVNNELGYKIDCPDNFFSDDAIEGEIDVIDSYSNYKEFARFKICAGYNKGNITAQNLYDEFAKIYGGKIEYNRLEDNWFAISLIEDNRYRYAYYNLKDDVIRGFEFHFTGEENYSIYSKYIDHIYESVVTQPPITATAEDYTDESLEGTWFFDAESYADFELEDAYKKRTIKMIDKNKAVIKVADWFQYIVFVDKNKAVSLGSYRGELNQSYVDVYLFDGDVITINSCDAGILFDTGKMKVLKNPNYAYRQ